MFKCNKNSLKGKISSINFTDNGASNIRKLEVEEINSEMNFTCN